jgi:hypothetical protein
MLLAAFHPIVTFFFLMGLLASFFVVLICLRAIFGATADRTLAREFWNDHKLYLVLSVGLVAGIAVMMMGIL